MHARRLLPVLGALALAAYLAVSLTPVTSWLAEATWKPPTSVPPRSGAPATSPGQEPPAAATELEGPTTQVGPTEAIVVLASKLDHGGSLDHRSLARTVEGIRLFRAGWAPLLVLSGNGSSSSKSSGNVGSSSRTRPPGGPGIEAHGKPLGPDSSPADAPPEEALLRAALARAMGVPATAILTVGAGRTTREEALRMTTELRPRSVRSIILVTDASHMARAAGSFARVGFVVRPAPVPVGGDGITVAETLVGEWLAWWYYRLAGYL